MRNQNYLKSVSATTPLAVPEICEPKDAFSGSIENLSQLAAALAAGLETIQAFDHRVGLPPVAEGIDFYAEVRRVEIFLIKQALRHTHGSQVKAASLLKLNPTTLNAKIQKYKILW